MFHIYFELIIISLTQNGIFVFLNANIGLWAKK